MEILHLHKIHPFLLLFTVTVFMLMCIGRKNVAFYFPSLTVLWHFQFNKKKVLILSYFPNFSISSVFLNYGIYLHGCAAVLIVFLFVYSLLRKVTCYSFVFTNKVKTMSIAPECCNVIFLKLTRIRTLCYIYKTITQSFCPRLDTLLK